MPLQGVALVGGEVTCVAMADHAMVFNCERLGGVDHPYGDAYVLGV